MMYILITAVIVTTIIMKFKWFMAIGLIIIFLLTQYGVI
jgi:hypothetical protein